MKKTDWIPDKTDISVLPQLDEGEIRFLWSCGWWDGPATGLAVYRGSKCWFHWHHEDESTSAGHFHFVLYQLASEQIAEAEAWYKSSGEWDGDKWIGRDTAVHSESWKSPNLSENQPIGWFKDGHNEDFYPIKIHRDSAAQQFRI